MNRFRECRCSLAFFVPGEFSDEFLPAVCTIYRRMFRIFAHIYYQHFTDIVENKTEPHVNTSFKHFYLFSEEFGLIEKRELVLTAQCSQ